MSGLGQRSGPRLSALPQVDCLLELTVETGLEQCVRQVCPRVHPLTLHPLRAGADSTQ